MDDKIVDGLKWVSVFMMLIVVGTGIMHGAIPIIIGIIPIICYFVYIVFKIGTSVDEGNSPFNQICNAIFWIIMSITSINILSFNSPLLKSWLDGGVKLIPQIVYMAATAHALGSITILISRCITNINKKV